MAICNKCNHKGVCGFQDDTTLACNHFQKEVVQMWISVKDRLPEKRGEYLCYYKFEPDSPDVICQNTYYGSGIWMSETDRVTHWMPLPQPPKGE